MMKVVLLLLAASLLTGCSLTNTASGTLDASGGAVTVSGSVAAEEKEEVSGGAVSASVATEEREDRELSDQHHNRLENSDNRYAIDYDALLLIQHQLDGTKIKETRIDKDIYSLEWVTDKWLYYSTRDEGADYILWRIPIRKTEKGDKLLMDKKEKVRRAEAINVDYVTDFYLILGIYGDSEKEGEGICKYDCKTGRMTELIPGKERAESYWSSYWGEYPVMWEGDLFYEGKENLYRLNPETGEYSSVYTFKSDSTDFGGIKDYAMVGENLYFLIEEESGTKEKSYNKLYRYDCANRKTECMLLNKELVRAAEQLKLGELHQVAVEELFLDQDTFFLDMYIVFSKEEPESGVNIFYHKYELFSVALEDFGKIRHEDKLMDYLDKKGKYIKSGHGEDSYEFHTGWTEGCMDGQILAFYQKEKDDDGRYVLYDLKTEEIKDMTEKELPEKYQELLSD